MKQFYETYRKHKKLSTLLRELPWSSHLHILAKTKNIKDLQKKINGFSHKSKE